MLINTQMEPYVILQINLEKPRYVYFVSHLYSLWFHIVGVYIS